MPDASPLLRICGLGKSYAAPVLADVNLDLPRGEVHALVGENGAGKSTLARILAGLTLPDAGTLALRGLPYAPRTKREAEQQGVRLVLQELNLIANLTVAENLSLDQLPHRCGWINRRELTARAREALARVGLEQLDPHRPVHSLGIGQQQLIEIAAGLARRCDLLILDEPTAALTQPEIERLFTQIRQLRAAGTAILYISHRLEEIQQIADQLTVLRDGRLVATRPVPDTSIPTIVRLMVGRDLTALEGFKAIPRGPEALRVENLRRPPAVHDVSFTLHRGEILGLAGLMGSGRTETLRALYGADTRAGGRIFLDGQPEPVALGSPREATRRGLALLTENRKEQGLWLPLAVRTNISLPSLPDLSWGRGWVSAARERAAARQQAEQLGVRCASLEQPIVELSGGNQQKAIAARWLLRHPSILLLDEPTRGVDIGARFELYRFLAQLAQQGKAILMASSDLLELMTVCDRIAVMSAGRLVATFDRAHWSEERIMAAALRGYLQRE